MVVWTEVEWKDVSGKFVKIICEGLGYTTGKDALSNLDKWIKCDAFYKGIEQAWLS